MKAFFMENYKNMEIATKVSNYVVKIHICSDGQH